MRRMLAPAVLFLFICAAPVLSFGKVDQIWSVEIEGITSSELMPDGGIVISAGNQAVVLDKYGNVRWSWKSSEPIYLLATDLFGDIYMAFGNTVAGLSKDGKLKWQIDAYDIVHALTVMDGILLVGWDHGLFALNLDGSFAWEYFKPPNC